MGLQRTCDYCKEVIPTGDGFFEMSLAFKSETPNFTKTLHVKIDAAYCEKCILNGMAQRELLEIFEKWRSTELRKENGRVKGQ